MDKYEALAAAWFQGLPSNEMLEDHARHLLAKLLRETSEAAVIEEHRFVKEVLSEVRSAAASEQKRIDAIGTALLEFYVERQRITASFEALLSRSVKMFPLESDLKAAKSPAQKSVGGDLRAEEKAK